MLSRTKKKEKVGLLEKNTFCRSERRCSTDKESEQQKSHTAVGEIAP